MSNQVQFSTFNFHSSDVRVITDPTGEHWFCGKDVCTILGYVNESLTLQKHCKPNGVSKRYLTDKLQRKQEAIFISEPNLYRLIIKSRKPEAEPFETWVFEEVLPQIRKTGKYEVEPKQMALPEPKTFNVELTEHDIKVLNVVLKKFAPKAKAFAKRVEQQQRTLYQTLGLDPLRHNPLAAEAYDIDKEFNYWLGYAEELIDGITAQNNCLPKAIF